MNKIKNKSIKADEIKKKVSLLRILLMISAFLIVILILIVVIALKKPSSSKNKKNVWENKVGVSNLYINNGNIDGEIQNKTNSYLNLKIILDLENGSIKEKHNCDINLTPNEIKQLDCNVGDNYNFYNVNVNNIILHEKEFKNNDKISDPELINFFPEFNNRHINFIQQFTNILSEGFENIHNETLYVSGDDVAFLAFLNDYRIYESRVSFWETYQVLPDVFSVRIEISYPNNDKIDGLMIDALAGTDYYSQSGYERAIYDAIKNGTGEDKCIKNKDLCVSKYSTDSFTYIVMDIKSDS